MGAILDFLVWHGWSLAWFFSALLALAFLNLWGFPKVSILIPVRDEEHNVETCLSSGLAREALALWAFTAIRSASGILGRGTWKGRSIHVKGGKT